MIKGQSLDTPNKKAMLEILEGLQPEYSLPSMRQLGAMIAERTGGKAPAASHVKHMLELFGYAVLRKLRGEE